MADGAVPLKEHFEALLNEAEKRNTQRFDAQQEAVTTALASAKEAVTTAMAAAEKAVSKAEIAADKRLDGLNELRQMALDWKTEFARQSTVDLQIKGLSDRFEQLQGTRSQGISGTVGVIVQIIASIAAVGAIIGVVVVLMRP